VSSVGWYPDPGGQPGQYRYWNGSSWSAETTTTPRQTPPPSGQATPGASTSRSAKKQSLGWWIALGAGVLVIALIIWAVIVGLPKITGQDNPWDQPGTAPVENFCTAGATSSSATPLPDRPGRVSGGHLSFPTMGTPWRTPNTDNRVPFGTVAMIQDALDQADYDGEGLGHDWVSSVLVSDLVSGDGFADAESASGVVLKCVLGKYYDNTVVTQKQLSSKAHNVDGHSGWLIETQLSFTVPGLKATGERVLLLVVQVEADQYGLFYASVPDTSPDRLPEARDALAKLRVDK
jgi:hypothetical protein